MQKLIDLVRVATQAIEAEASGEMTPTELLEILKQVNELVRELL